MTDIYYPYASEAEYHSDLAAIDTDKDYNTPPDAEYFAMQDEYHKAYTERLLFIVEMSQ